MTEVTGAQDEREDALAALRMLAGLADRAEEQGWAKLAAALRATVDAVEGRLKSSELSIVLAGGHGKRTLKNVLAGEELFASTGEAEASAFFLMRRARRIRYVARMHDGHVEDFSLRHPDRAAWFEREIAKAEQELEAARLRVTTVDVELTAKDETLSERRIRAAERLREEPGLVERARALYAIVVAWILGILGARSRAQLPAPASRRSPAADGRVVSAMIARRDIERVMETAQSEVAKRERDVARIRAEAASHDKERRAIFVTEVRALTDGARRASDVAELAIDIDDGVLPEGIVVIDAPAAVMPGDAQVRGSHLRDLRDRAGACFIVAAPGSVAIGELEDAVRPIVPHVIDATEMGVGGDDAFASRLREALPALFERARAEARLSVLAIALADMPARMHALAAAVAAGEAELEARIDALERERLPDPQKFREEQLVKMAESIDEGARRVQKRARVRLRERAADLEAECTAAIESSTDWADLERAVERVDALVAGGVRRLLDEVGDDVGSEMQTTSELLELWVLDEVRRRYQTPELHADMTAPVVAELPSEEIAGLREPLLLDVLRAFTRRRFGFAFGSVATGAAIGGAVHAVSGAVIGAAAGLVAGVIASFAPRIQSAKSACVARIRARIAGAEHAIAAWLDASSGSFARDIRAAVDDTLADALKRRDQSIVRLIELEGKALEREQQTLRHLTGLKSALDEHAARFAALAAKTATELREHVAATR